jgi:DNA polymerase III epsilon subunit-like protein
LCRTPAVSSSSPKVFDASEWHANDFTAGTITMSTMNRRSFLAGVLSSPLVSALARHGVAAESVEPAPPYTTAEVEQPAQDARIALKISTTGPDPEYGHYIYEIAGVRIAGDTVADLCFHQYLSPPQKSICGLPPSYGAPPWFLRDDIHFGQIANQFVECLRGTHIVVHNARLELAFLDHELKRAGLGPLRAYSTSVTDTKVIARQLFGTRARRSSLDSLCELSGLTAPNKDIYRSGVAYASVVAQNLCVFSRTLDQTRARQD